MATFSFLWSVRACVLTALLAFSSITQADVAATGGATVSSTVLILARDFTAAQNSGFPGLQGHGIPYEVVTIPQAGGTLPVLNSTAKNGNYGGILVISEVGYDYNGSYYSALTRRQWQTLWEYQEAFGVRMVRLDVFPSSDFGVSSSGGNAKDEPVVITNSTGFPTAGLKT